MCPLRLTQVTPFGILAHELRGNVGIKSLFRRTCPPINQARNVVNKKSIETHIEIEHGDSDDCIALHITEPQEELTG